MELVIDPVEQRRAHLLGDFGPEWEAVPNAEVYGNCPDCAKARTVRRRVIGDHISWDMICSSKNCPTRAEP